MKSTRLNINNWLKVQIIGKTNELLKITSLSAQLFLSFLKDNFNEMKNAELKNV